MVIMAQQEVQRCESLAVGEEGERKKS